MINLWKLFSWESCEWHYWAAFRKGLDIYKGKENIYASVWVKLLERAVIHLGVNLTSAAETRSPGAEGRAFSSSFKIIYSIASPPEHLVLVSDWGYGDGCAADLIHPRKTSYSCMCSVKVIVNALDVFLRVPTWQNLLLCWLELCYELPHKYLTSHLKLQAHPLCICHRSSAKRTRCWVSGSARWS